MCIRDRDYEIVEKKEEKRIEWNVQKDAETPLVVNIILDKIWRILESADNLVFTRWSCWAVVISDMRSKRYFGFNAKHMM